MTDKTKLKKSLPCGSAKEINNQEKNVENKHCEFEDLDHSLLQHPLNLGVTNIKQIFKCIQNGSKEVKDILLNECNVIYECKVCASLFRSLANFLYHKRCYCKKHLCEEMVLFENFVEESEIATVQPELDQVPPIENSVYLIKTDISDDTSIMDITQGESNIPKEKLVRGKGDKVKEYVDNVDKKTMKEVKVSSPMISRRTREKKSMNITKRTVKDLLEDEHPKKIIKSVNKGNSICRSSTEDKMIVDNEDVSEQEIQSAEQMECLDVYKNDTKEEQVEFSEVSEKEISKEQVETSIVPEKEITEQVENSLVSKKEIKDGLLESFVVKKLKSMKEQMVSEKEIVEKQEEHFEVFKKETNGDKMKSTDVLLEQIETDKPQQDVIDKKEIKSGVEGINLKIDEVNDIVIEKLPKQMYPKSLKKVIVTKPNTVNLQNINVFDGIRSKNIKSNKLGLTNIANATGKNLQCLPKIIFKALDGNPHAVFQSTDSVKSPKLVLKNKLGKATLQNKIDKERVVIVMKKDSRGVEVETESVEMKKSQTQTEFHLTRRKKLLARSDCNVQDLRCLNCNSQFISLKTLYFHMLSIHSKKRLYYPCPFCKALFVQVYGVTRHLRASHNKTKEQINKLRSHIKKKSVWKKVEENKDEVSKENKNEVLKENKSGNTQKDKSKLEVKVVEIGSTKTSNTMPAAKADTTPSKVEILHKCSKCGRLFGRKSSQVSHEKFCIMNAIQVETADSVGPEIAPPPNMSFFPLSPQMPVTSNFHKPPGPKLDIRISCRPKRGAEKQMHKDFVNSQTLKWRSANRVDTTPKPVPITKKKIAKHLEKKVMNIMSVENLLCTKCDKKFSSYSNLRRHVAIHVGWTRFKCKYCEYQAYNKSQCWGHVQKAHSVSEEDLDKSVVNLGNRSGRKMLLPAPPVSQPAKNNVVKGKDPPSKLYGIKTKVSKKKAFNKDAKHGTEKRQRYILKKGYPRPTIKKKEVPLPRKERSQSLDNKNTQNIKKEKVQGLEVRRDCLGAKQKNENAIYIKKNMKEKSLNLKLVDSPSEAKGKNNSFRSIFKLGVQDQNKEASGYKAVTTNTPTTIILSKKFQTQTVQPFVAHSAESSLSTSFNKTSSLRSSPRKSDSKTPEESMKNLVGSTKGSETLKMLMQSNSTEILKVTDSSDKNLEKDKLISEWFPKKNLNSNSSRRESAPLIIGLVPAANTGATNPRTKNPAISYERHNT